MKPLALISFSLVTLGVGLFSQIVPQPPLPTVVNWGQLPQIVAKGGGPQQAVTVVQATTPNSFPLPKGTSLCIVTRNIAQSPGVDYNITSGAVIFTAVPTVGDTVQLNCW